MARGGVYRSEVEKARNSLIAQGVHPSIDAVRVALGNTGSKSTIHRYLKEIEAEERVGTTGKVAVSDAVQDLAGRLAARLHEEADAMITEAKEKSDAALATQKNESDELRRQITELSAQLQRTEVALHAKADEHAAALQQNQEQAIGLAKLTEHATGLERQMAERDTHIRSLEEKHQHAHEALDHFRNATKEQRDQDQRRHEHEVQGLQVTLRQANEVIGTKNEELLKLNRDNGRLVAEVAEKSKELTHLQQDEQRLQLALKDHEAVVRERQRLAEHAEQALREVERLKAALTEARTDAENARAACAAAEAKSTKAEGRTGALEAVAAELRSQLKARVAEKDFTDKRTA